MSSAGIDRDWAALAHLVRERRLELGIPSQKAAAEQAGVHVNTWNVVENGKPVSMESIEAIATVLRWHPSYPMAILREGVDAPKHIMAGGSSNVRVHAGRGAVVAEDRQDAIARPETVRGTAHIPAPYVETRFVTATDSAGLSDTASIVVNPAPVSGRMSAGMPAMTAQGRGTVSPPAEPVLPKAGLIPITPSMSLLATLIPLPADVTAELTDDDITWVIEALTKQGRELVSTIARTKQRERSQRERRDEQD